MRHCSWVRKQLFLKPDTYTESYDVDVAGINVKVSAHYPGRSPSEKKKRSSEKSAEVIVVWLTIQMKDRT